MSALTFQAMVGEDQILRPPADVILPKGQVEVTVRPLPAASTEPIDKTRSWLLGLARESERLAPDLPTDLAEQHDHFAHGKPRP